MLLNSLYIPRRCCPSSLGVKSKLPPFSKAERSQIPRPNCRFFSVSKVTLPKPDYYKILGVDKKADDTTIKKAFFELAKKWHPDVNKTPAAKQKFVEINTAYEILRDKQKREAYDLSSGEDNPYTAYQQYQQQYQQRNGNYSSQQNQERYRDPFASRNSGHSAHGYQNFSEFDRGFNSFEEFVKQAQQQQQRQNPDARSRQTKWSKTYFERDAHGNIRIRTVSSDGSTAHESRWEGGNAFEDVLRKYQRGPARENPWSKIFDAVTKNKKRETGRPTIFDWPANFEIKQFLNLKPGQELTSEFQIQSAKSFLGSLSEKFLSAERGCQFSYQQPHQSVSKARFWVGLDGRERGVIEDAQSVRIATIEEIEPSVGLFSSILPRCSYRYKIFGDTPDKYLGSIYSWNFILNFTIFTDASSTRIGTATGSVGLTPTNFSVQLTRESMIDASIYLFVLAWKTTSKMRKNLLKRTP